MKRIIFFTLLGLAILSMIHSVESVYNLWKKRDIITQTQQQVQKEKDENTTLKQQLHTISTTGFVEEEARNKLFMVKPGEKVVFLPANALASTSGKEKASVQTLSNWDQWIRLFFQ